jgi:integrase
MAAIKLKYVNKFRNKHRKDRRLRYYFRRRGGKAIPLPGLPGSDEFMAAYAAALTTTSSAPTTEIGADRTTPGTINALVVNYLKSSAWLNDIAEDTRKNRRHVIERFREKHGDKRVALLRRDHFETMLKEIKTPATKHFWLRAIRSLMRSGIPSMLKADPTAGIAVKRSKTAGHHTWTEAEIARYRAHHPLGTQARLVLEFALQTMSRRGEIVRLGPQHAKRGQNGEWRIKIERIKGSNPVDIPMTPELLAACQAMPRTGLAYITGQSGKPLAKMTLGRKFAKWATEAGLPNGCRLHGLKKSGMCSIVLAGGTAPELLAWSGHKDMEVAQKYIEEAFKRPELADAAFAKLRTKRGGIAQTSPSPVHKHSKKAAKNGPF